MTLKAFIAGGAGWADSELSAAVLKIGNFIHTKSLTFIL
jgi:hypothetical protein